MQGKNVFPIANEVAWRNADQCMAFANEMCLVEIAGFVNNFGPGLTGSFRCAVNAASNLIVRA